MRKRDVTNNDDADMTREPEMVQAYRDTWQLGLHSYLTYLRDRLLVARDLLTPSGSVFVQITDENMHHVRELMDEIFQPTCYAGTIFFLKTSGKGSGYIDPIGDYLLWYVRDPERAKVNPVFVRRQSSTIDEQYNMADFPDGTTRRLSAAEIRGDVPLPHCKRFMPSSIYSDSGGETTSFTYQLDGGLFRPLSGYYWRTTVEGPDRLKQQGRLIKVELPSIQDVCDDFPISRFELLG